MSEEIEAWARSLKDVFKLLPDNCWIAGGALRSLLVHEKVNDYDIWAADPLRVVGFMKSKCADEDSGVRLTFEDDNVANFKVHGRKIQVIKKYAFASPLDTINAFDFTIVAAAYDGKTIVAHDRFYMDNAQRRLVIVDLKKPMSTLMRAFKYAERGYRICPVALNRIIRTISDMRLDFDNPQQNDLMFYPDGSLRFRGLD